MKLLTARTIFVVAAIGAAITLVILITQPGPSTEAAGDRWPDNEVPFYIDEHVNDDHRNAIYQAVAIWEERTALNFIELDLAEVKKHERNYLHYIDRGSNNHSYKFSDIKKDGDLDAFPYLKAGDWVVKFIDCGSTCSGAQEKWDDNYHVPLHETGHVLGLPHEQKRNDRGDVVRFYPCCADESEESFEKSLQHVEALKPYDIKSIMQYASTGHCRKSGSGADRRCACLPLLEKTPGEIYLPSIEFTNGYQQTKNDVGECADKLEVYGRVIEENPGLSIEDINTIYQMYPPRLGDNETGDRLGEAMAAGDFDGDGYTDLAVGAPGESPYSDPQSGAVFLFKGTHTGLVNWRILTQTGLGVNQSGDKFGQTLAAGDFNDDGRADLIVGAPGEKVGGYRGGAVFVFLGSITGPTTENGYLLHQDNIGFSGGSNDGDEFGAALAVGNFNGDSRVDLAIGAPGKNPGGRVYTLKWDKTRAAGDKFVKFDRLGSQRVAGDMFGAALAAADVNSDGLDDLVVGAPGTSGVGAIFVFTGGTANFHDGTQIKQPEGAPRQPLDYFGAALATGHFAGGARPQIVVGAPGKKGYGMIFVLRLLYNGHTFSKIDRWDGYDQGTLATNSTGDNFGQFFAVADFDRDGKDDLAVGIPLKDVYVYSESGAETIFNAGAVALFRGNAINEFLKEWTIYYQPVSYGDYRLENRFGGAVAAGNFNIHPSFPDLAIGVPGKDDPESTDSGAMFVARGRNEGQSPILSQDENPTVAAEPPANRSFWHFFNQELAQRR